MNELVNHLSAEDLSLLSNLLHREMMKTENELRAMRSFNSLALPRRFSKMKPDELREQIDPHCSLSMRLRHLRDIFDSLVPELKDWSREAKITIEKNLD
jgi:hypothetical protein